VGRTDAQLWRGAGERGHREHETRCEVLGEHCEELVVRVTEVGREVVDSKSSDIVASQRRAFLSTPRSLVKMATLVAVAGGPSEMRTFHVEIVQ
jgi:hypothetical protein